MTLHFRRSGVVRVETLNGLFDCAKTLLMQPSPNAPDLTIITNAGGPALMAVDQLNRRGGKLSEISDSTIQSLRNILPYYCGLTNPIDLLEEATPERYRKVIKTCINDNVNSNLLVMYAPTGLTDPMNLANTVIDSAKQTRKNIFVCLMGEDPQCQEARRTLHRNSVPTFRNPQEAVRTFMNIYAHTQNLELLYQTPDEISIDRASPIHLKGILRRAYSEGRETLNLPESFQFLEAYKIPVVKTVIAKTAEESAAFASQLGYPIMMKPLGTQYFIKLETQTLAYDVFSPAQLAFQFNQLADEIGIDKIVDFQGIVMQSKVLYAPCKLFLGLRKDPQFGSIICLGTGGALIEKDRELSIGFPPLNQVLAKQIIENTKAVQYCKDAVCSEKFESTLIEEILIRFSQLAVDFPEIKKIDVNPIIIKDGKACAVDAQIMLDLHMFLHQGAEHSENLVIAPYPKKYVTQRTLKNGAKVTFRPINLRTKTASMHSSNLYPKRVCALGFLRPSKKCRMILCYRYCNLDYDREIAIVAQLDDSSLIGVVRLIFDSERKNGEFAVMVSDSWHGFRIRLKTYGLYHRHRQGLKIRINLQRNKPRKCKDAQSMPKQRLYS